MRVTMLVSMNIMPDWLVLEQGQTYDVDAEMGHAWLDAGLCEAVPGDGNAQPAPAVTAKRATVERAAAGPQRQKRGKA